MSSRSATWEGDRNPVTGHRIRCSCRPCRVAKRNEYVVGTPSKPFRQHPNTVEQEKAADEAYDKHLDANGNRYQLCRLTLDDMRVFLRDGDMDDTSREAITEWVAQLEGALER